MNWKQTQSLSSVHYPSHGQRINDTQNECVSTRLGIFLFSHIPHNISIVGDEGLVRPGGEIPGHEVRRPDICRGLQEGHDGEVPENGSGMRGSNNFEGQS